MLCAGLGTATEAIGEGLCAKLLCSSTSSLIITVTKVIKPLFRETIMDKTFQKFLRSGIDLSPVGVERREGNNPYFCTPKGASIFGWAGVDGIHFCFIRGFGGMVFAVSPMNSAPDFVHPLSKDFADFLRLLLACGDVAALEQAWMWDEAQFEAFLRNSPPTQAQQVRLSEVAARLNLTPMEHPWAYLKELQASFDYGKIKYTEDYYCLLYTSPSPRDA